MMMPAISRALRGSPRSSDSRASLSISLLRPIRSLPTSSHSTRASSAPQGQPLALGGLDHPLHQGLARGRREVEEEAGLAAGLGPPLAAVHLLGAQDEDGLRDGLLHVALEMVLGFLGAQQPVGVLDPDHLAPREHGQAQGLLHHAADVGLVALQHVVVERGALLAQGVLADPLDHLLHPQGVLAGQHVHRPEIAGLQVLVDQFLQPRQRVALAPCGSPLPVLHDLGQDVLHDLGGGLVPRGLLRRAVGTVQQVVARAGEAPVLEDGLARGAARQGQGDG